MPDYEITIAGRMGPVVASCLPDLHCVAPPATVLHAIASNDGVLLRLLELLTDRRLTLIDVRIDPVPTGSPQSQHANRERPPDDG